MCSRMRNRRWTDEPPEQEFPYRSPPDEHHPSHKSCGTATPTRENLDSSSRSTSLDSPDGRRKPLHPARHEPLQSWPATHGARDFPEHSYLLHDHTWITPIAPLHGKLVP